jgi:NAD(P)-dependent dehydrogenase (short-subunit alcohol dehydrogenase family)
VPSVLITGAGRGIGRAAVLRMADAGWDVYAGVRRAEDAPEGDRVTPVVLDVTDAEQLAALDGALPERLDAVVNNAGVVVSGPVEGLDLDDLRRQLDVNVTAQVAVTQAVLPRLRESRGRVLFVSSVSGRVASPLTGAYNASKFAIEGIADALRMELRPWGIAVVLIEPGSVDTDLWRNAQDTASEAEAAMRPEHRELYAEHLAGMRKAITRIQKQAGPVDKVAGAIEQALTADRPRARYLVGPDARVQVAMRAALPTRGLDAVISKATGQPRSA